MVQLIPMAAAAAAATIQDIRQQKQQKKLNEQGKADSKELMDYQNQKQLEMWEKTGYSAQMKQMRNAGLNPGLMYGMGGGGGQTTGNAGISYSGGQAAPGGGMEAMMAMGMQLGLQSAQKRLLEAQASKAEAEAEQTKGPGTENLKADTENKILAGVIAKYTGLELKDVYEQISSQPNQRYAQSKEKEGAALGNAAVGYNLWQLHEEGKLKDKSIAEIEDILLKNAKSREERNMIIKQMEAIEKTMKGTDLDNALKELDVELSKKLGLDRGSNEWMRIIGRLFLKITGL